MLTKDQLALRKTGITATDAVVLAGLSPYRDASPLRVYAEKVGAEVEPLTGERLELGHDLEPIILKRLAARRDLVLVPGETARSRLHATHLATPDGLHKPNGELRAVAEAKAVGLHNAGMWGEEGEEIPDHVLAQVTWQMHCLQVDQGYVGALIGTEIRTYLVAIDHDLVGALVEVADRFWTDHVKKRVPPKPDGTDGATSGIAMLFPRHRAALIKSTPALDALAQRYLALRAQGVDVERRLGAIEQEMKLIIGDAEGVDGGDWRCVWKAQDAVEVKAHVRKASRPFKLTEKKAKGRVAA